MRYLERRDINVEDGRRGRLTATEQPALLLGKSLRQPQISRPAARAESRSGQKLVRETSYLLVKASEQNP
jgi:hypothetical protein